MNHIVYTGPSAMKDAKALIARLDDKLGFPTKDRQTLTCAEPGEHPDKDVLYQVAVPIADKWRVFLTDAELSCICEYGTLKSLNWFQGLAYKLDPAHKVVTVAQVQTSTNWWVPAIIAAAVAAGLAIKYFVG